MKALIIPAVIAILAGVGGGSGYAYMRASKKYVADSTHLADSLKANPPTDSTSHDSTSHDAGAHDSTQSSLDSVATALESMTPADSIRLLEAERTLLRNETKGLADAKPVASGDNHAAPAGTTKNTAASRAPAGGKPTDTHASTSAPAAAPTVVTPKPSGESTRMAADAVKDATKDAMGTALPEARLARIFGAMKAKEAAKVLDQMNDGDVRTILSMMTDKQAGAILAALPAARAAAVTKGAVRTPGATP